MLEEALAHFQVVTDYGEGDLTEQKTVDAICMRLSAGIEADRRQPIERTVPVRIDAVRNALSRLF